MSQGIFISYSRDDQKQALALLQMLRKEGYNVWIDQEAIPGASIWSDEIVQNIKSCDIFIALLSESSVSSPNVAKEIGLAAENGKIILPVEIGTVVLPGRLEYALAGIQRTNYHNEDAILHAIRKQAEKSDEPREIHKHHKTRKQRIRQRTFALIALAVLFAGGFFFMSRNSSEKEIPNNSVIVLPFATMNLDQDSIRNLDVFSDAIMKRLSTLTTLTSTGPSVSSTYNKSPLNPLAIAKELKARYIVEGLVRKHSDVDFVSVRIFDLKKGGEMWEQFYRGNIRELFDTRERVCEDVFNCLRDISTSEKELEVLEKNVRDHPDNALANAALAKALIGNDNIRSLYFYQKAIKADSSNENYFITAGIVADRLKESGLAREFGNAGAAITLKKLKAHPDSMDLATTYCIALDVSGKFALSGHLYDSLMRIYPTATRLYFNAACNLARQGESDKAIDVLEKLRSFAPGKLNETRSDPDFDNIRMYPRYIKLMASMSN